MERKTTPVTVDNDGFSHHPSFGTIAVSRVTGSYPRKFFGSDVEPCNYIEIVIRDAEQQRSLNNDWVIGRNQIISLRLTPLQYAEMLTNLNCGTGVPCTIEFIRGEGTIPEAEIKSKIDILHDESDARFDTTLDILDEVSEQLKELSQSGKLSKRAETELTRKLGIVSYNLSTRETD